jgi:uncharacterized protein with FMN-binding domain
MNRDQVHSIMTVLAIGGSVVGGIIITQHEVAGQTISLPPLPTATSHPSASGSPSSSASASASASSGTVTKTGDLINLGDRWGDFAQVKVTKTNGTVSDVALAQSYATSRWQGAYPVLAQSAVQSNGAQVANLSGATYVSAVFNAALASAMSKF